MQTPFSVIYSVFLLDLLFCIIPASRLPTNAASNIQGIILASKQRSRRRVTASGFFIVTPRSEAVITAAQKAVSSPVRRARPKPMLTPQKMTGKKWPPFQPDLIQTLVIISFTRPEIIKTHGANSPILPFTSLMLSSPENITSGKYVPVIPRIMPPSVVLTIIPKLLLILS